MAERILINANTPRFLIFLLMIISGHQDCSLLMFVFQMSVNVFFFVFKAVLADLSTIKAIPLIVAFLSGRSLH